MQDELNTEYRSSARVGAIALAVLGMSVLIGWAANIAPLLTVLPGRVTMKPNTAVGFLGAGLAILCLTNKTSRLASRRLATIFAIVVIGLGTVTSFEYGMGLDLAVDQLLFKDSTQYPFPGRMAHITAVNFCLSGFSLLFLALYKNRATGSQLLSLSTGVSALLAIIGYLYGVPLLYGSIRYTSMALHTGLGFLLLSAATLCCRPQGGIMAAISSSHAGGWLARRLIPIAVVGPTLLGAVCAHSNFYVQNMRLALACLIMSLVVISVTLIWGLAFRLNRSEVQRSSAATALQNTEQNYRSMVEDAIIGIFQSTPSGKLSLVNPAMARIFGYESGKEMIEAVVDIATQLYVDPQRRHEFQQLIEQHGTVRDFECEMYRKDGSKVWLSTNARAVKQEGTTIGYDGTFEDITERKSLEAQLRQSQKMEAVGRLAGGIAHDFNNAIGVVIGYSGLLTERVSSDSTSMRYADEIGKAGHRAAALTRQLLAFSRKQVIQPVVLDLNTVVSETEKMIRRLIGEDIDITIIRDPQLGRVRADPGQIDQILMNLAVNARDAMPKGGRIVIETANAELDATNLGQHRFVKPGRYVMFSVSDTGCGMTKETQAQIFEPFFTTKPPGQGTGLGLSTVYGIVKQSEGYVWVYSELQQGARFKVFLPRVEAAIDRVRPVDNSAIPGGTETILLVEDDEAMRMLTLNCLKSGGYTVVDVHEGEAAIQVVSQHAGPIHLLLTDVVMPGLSGRHLAESLAVARPEIKVLYMSGYTADIIAQRGILEPEVTLIEKPFTKEALLRKVRKVLDGERSAQSAAAGQE